MSKATITTLQIPVSDYVERNVKTLKRNILAHKLSDWIVTPECALSGYCQPPALHNMDKTAEGKLFKALEKVNGEQEHNRTGLILGTGWVESNGLPYNQARVYHRDGHLISTYNKRLLCRGRGPVGGGETNHYLPGYEPNFFYVDPDQTVIGTTLICNDAWASPGVTPDGNPFFGWDLARQGVKIVFVLANCNVKDWDPVVYAYHESSLRLMARDNNVWVVVANSSIAMGWGPHDRYDPDTELEQKSVERVQVSSGIIDPQGNWAAWCDDTGEDYVTLTIDFDKGICYEPTVSNE
jgi:predicted amidohydrolase